MTASARVIPSVPGPAEPSQAANEPPGATPAAPVPTSPSTTELTASAGLAASPRTQARTAPRPIRRRAVRGDQANAASPPRPSGRFPPRPAAARSMNPSTRSRSSPGPDRRTPRASVSRAPMVSIAAGSTVPGARSTRTPVSTAALGSSRAERTVLVTGGPSGAPATVRPRPRWCAGRRRPATGRRRPRRRPHRTSSARWPGGPAGHRCAGSRGARGSGGPPAGRGAAPGGQVDQADRRPPGAGRSKEQVDAGGQHDPSGDQRHRDPGRRSVGATPRGSSASRRPGPPRALRPRRRGRPGPAGPGPPRIRTTAAPRRSVTRASVASASGSPRWPVVTRSAKTAPTSARRASATLRPVGPCPGRSRSPSAHRPPSGAPGGRQRPGAAGREGVGRRGQPVFEPLAQAPGRGRDRPARAGRRRPVAAPARRRREPGPRRPRGPWWPGVTGRRSRCPRGVAHPALGAPAVWLGGPRRGGAHRRSVPPGCDTAPRPARCTSARTRRPPGALPVACRHGEGRAGRRRPVDAAPGRWPRACPDTAASTVRGH